MKKNILLLAFVLISGIASAQFTVWEDDFNDGEVSDWTLLDSDGNSSNWLARKNIQFAGGQVTNGTVDVLGSYHINLTTGSSLGGAPENNWAITPAIDLSFYAAPIELNVNFQTCINGGDRTLYVYVSNSPDQESFLLTTPTALFFDRVNSTAVEFSDHIIDLSAYAGQSQVYIALVATVGVGMEVDKVNVTATNILGIGDTTKKPSASIIKQNPVVENLQIQLGNTVNAANTVLKIYNTTGMLVKETKYNEENIAVNNLSSGVYFVVLSDGTTTEKMKFIKK